MAQEVHQELDCIPKFWTVTVIKPNRNSVVFNRSIKGYPPIVLKPKGWGITLYLSSYDPYARQVTYVQSISMLGV